MLFRIVVLLMIAAGAYLLRKKLTGNPGAEDLYLPADYKLNNKSLPTIVYFWTEQCSQCRLVQKPVIQRLENNPGKFNLVSVNAFEDREAASRFKIMTVPSTVVFSRDGKSKYVNNGLISEKELLKQLNKVLI